MKKYLILLIKIILLILIYKFIISKINFTELLFQISEIDLIFFLMGAILFPLHILFATFRFKFALKILNEEVSFLNSLNANFYSFASNIFLPAKSGDLLKIFTLPHVKQKSKIFTGVLLERFNDILILLLITFFSSIFINNNIVTLFSFLIIISIIFSIMVFNFLIKKINLSFAFFKKIKEAYFVAIFFLKKKNNLFFVISLFSFLVWYVGGLQTYLFLKSFGFDQSLFIVLVYFPLVIFSTLIPITPSGFGIRELSFIYFFGQFIDHNICIVVSLLYFTFSTLMNGIISIFFLNNLKLKTKRND